MTRLQTVRVDARRFARFPGRLRLVLERLEDRTLLNAHSPLLQLPTLTLDPTDYDSASVLVRFNDAADLSLPNLPGATIESLPLVNGLHRVRLASDMTVADALAALEGDSRIAYAQPNYRLTVSSYLPNDPHFGEQWALHNIGQAGEVDADIDAPEAWDVARTSPGVIVAILDTGIDYNHPDLAGNIWTNSGEVPGNGIDDDGNGYIDDVHGWNFVDNNGNIMDDYGHGTHVAGIIGAVGDNGIGVAGVTWSVQLMAIKFLDGSGNGWISSAIEALNYAVANGATISNNSWSGGGYDQALVDAIATAGAMDHLFVVAAGNGGRDNDLFPIYPATYDLPNILTVAATDQFDQLAGFSNYGRTSVDLGAPGVNIISTVAAAGVVAGAGGYGSLTGTSMAAPFVTGVAALLRSQNAGWSYQQIVNRILSTVDPLPSLETTTVSGGRLNAAAALNATEFDDIQGPYIVNSTPTGDVTGAMSHLRVTFSETIDPASFTADDVVFFSGPHGSVPVTGVVAVGGANNRQFDITFASQTALGSYSFMVGPNIADLAGNTMDQNRDGLKGQGPADAFTAGFNIVPDLVYPNLDGATTIGDFGVNVSQINVGTHFAIADVDVQVNILHPKVDELHVYLVGPSGVVVILSAYRGDGANFLGTIFDDEATVDIAAGHAPFVGSYRPETSLDLLDGTDAYGTWMLFIEDWSYGNAGQLLDWSLIIKPEDNAPPTTVNDGNFGPVALNDYVSVLEDTPIVIAVLANDFTINGTLSITGVSNVQGGAAVVNANNTVTFTPAPDWSGAATFTYTVSNGYGHTTAEVFINVLPRNDAPVAVSDSAVTMQDTPLIFNGAPGNPPKVTANDTDVDGPALWVAGVGNATHGTVYLNKLGDVVFRPDSGYVGPARFEYTVSDGLLTSTTHVDVYVQAVNVVSVGNGGKLGDVVFTGADLVSVITGQGGEISYQMLFDGSDVGLSAKSERLSAFTFLPNGSLLVSTVGNYNVPKAGGGRLKGGGQDILQFWYTQLGETTAGYWTRYLKGSDVGLSSPTEKIDALAVLPNGRLIISTTGLVVAPGVIAQGEDLIALRPDKPGNNKSGFWSLYFDGSDVGLSGRNENVTGMQVTPRPGKPPLLHLTIGGHFTMLGAAGTPRDIVAFMPQQLGASTRGRGRLALHSQDLGVGAMKLNGFRLGATPLIPTSAAPSRHGQPPADYVKALEALPPSPLAPYEAPALENNQEGQVQAASLPESTASPLVIRDAVNRLFAAWGRPGADHPDWLLPLADHDATLPLVRFFAQLIRRS
jgi:serine protease